MNEEELVEFRCMVPRWAMTVFDARAKGMRRTKQEMGCAVVAEWAKAELHASTVVMRCARGNADEHQSDWGQLGA